MAMIREALAHSRQQSDLAVGLAPQQRSPLGAQLPLVKTGAHLAGKMWCKCELSLVTLCHRKGCLSRDINYDFDTRSYARKCGLFLLQTFSLLLFSFSAHEKCGLRTFRRRSPPIQKQKTRRSTSRPRTVRSQ